MLFRSLSEALKTIYSLIWDDFCSWYLEWIKPGFEQPVHIDTVNKTIEIYEELVQLLHPFMPFITEEIYHLLREQATDLTIKQYKPIQPTSQATLDAGEQLKQLITAVRDTRNKYQLKQKEAITLQLASNDIKSIEAIKDILAKQINAKSLSIVSTLDNTKSGITVVVGKTKILVETEIGRAHV